MNSNKRIVIALLVVVVVGGAVVSSLYVLSLGITSTTINGLPPAAQSPRAGFSLSPATSGGTTASSWAWASPRGSFSPR